MKKATRILCCLVLLIAAAFALRTMAMAEDGEPDTTWQDDFTYTTSAYTLILSKYNGTAEDLTIPATARIGGAEYTVQLSPDCHEFFYYKSKLKTVTFAPGVDTGLVTSMRDMFRGCTNLTSVSGLTDVHSVVNMNYLFNSCSKLTSIEGIEDWDTSHVTSMYGVFSGCRALTSLDLHSWDVHSVTDMTSMFGSCTSLTSLNLRDWDARAVVSATNGMYHMFAGCSSLTSLDGLSGWQLSSGRMSGMFYGCSSLTSLDLHTWNTTGIKSIYNMFTYCGGLVSLNVTGWDVGSVTTMASMFNNCAKLRQIIGINGWNPTSVTTTALMFNECRSLPALDLSGWRPVSLQNLNLMFTLCGFTSLDLSGWTLNQNNTIAMGGMFTGCRHLSSLNISGWDMTMVGMVDTVADMQLYRFFGYCDSLREIRTPLNLSDELQTDLPGEFTRQDDASVTYTTLPTGQTVSFTIVRGAIPFGTSFSSQSFTLPAGTVTVEANAFEGAYMAVVTVPEGCVSLGDHAFKDCVALTQIRIPANCSLGADVFEGCIHVFIYGTANSPADLYCRTHDNCEFVAE